MSAATEPSYPGYVPRTPASDEMLRRLGPLASLGAIAAILLIGVGYLSFGVVRVGWFTEHTEATMTIPDSGGLLPRSKVLLSGIEIGQITAVAHTREGIDVSFRYDAEYLVPTNSSVRIETLSALGEPYLEFRPTAADGPYLRDGDRLAAASVQRPVSIPEVARTATQLLEQVDPATVAAIIDNFSIGLAGTESVIPQLSRAGDLLAATLLSRTDLIRKLLADLQTQATDMTWAGGELTAASTPWADFGPRVGEVAAAIARVVRIGDTPADYLTDTEDVVGLLPFLAALTTQLDQLGPELRELFPVVQPLLALTTGVIGKIDLGSLISQALHATTPDGALQLQITVR
ncbi:MlaD family protein [Nocardia lijiangensis]|uniref:MlaD family protein n=1 Tax=Nocardia lijiangensis TaxID=299618 RepID=UPI000A0301A6|nr:MlaD family protein [Nocardia lijiangensis]